MKNPFLLLTFLIGTALTATAQPKSTYLWDHLADRSELKEVRGVEAEFNGIGEDRVLSLKVPSLSVATGVTGNAINKGIAWVSIAPPSDGWDLTMVKNITAVVKNTGGKSAEVTLWVAANKGWDAVGNAAILEPGKTATLTCDLRQTYPDKTPKLNPQQIKEIRIMIQRTDSATLAVSQLTTNGTAETWQRPPGRLDVPDMEIGDPATGKRVRYQLPADAKAKNEIYSSLYLPHDWHPDNTYPVIFEFPGNIFFRSTACWSTGRPEQCTMGYGISKGENAIWLSLPFIMREDGVIAESGFGSNNGEDTTAYAQSVIEDICENWGGDRNNLYLCGFSRGSIACGYIGLRNDHIAKYWKGIIGCQHYDGSRWQQSRMEEAVLRAPRFQGKAILQIDNSKEKYQPVADATDPSVKWTWMKSGLGYHATAMFLDDRPSTVQVRKWFKDLIAE